MAKESDASPAPFPLQSHRGEGSRTPGPGRLGSQRGIPGRRMWSVEAGPGPTAGPARSPPSLWRRKDEQISKHTESLRKVCVSEL